MSICMTSPKVKTRISLVRAWTGRDSADTMTRLHAFLHSAFRSNFDRPAVATCDPENYNFFRFSESLFIANLTHIMAPEDRGEQNPTHTATI